MILEVEKTESFVFNIDESNPEFQSTYEGKEDAVIDDWENYGDESFAIKSGVIAWVKEWGEEREIKTQ